MSFDSTQPLTVGRVPRVIIFQFVQIQLACLLDLNHHAVLAADLFVIFLLVRLCGMASEFEHLAVDCIHVI